MAINLETRALIDTVVAFQTENGWPLDCPLILWLQQQVERDANVVREELVARPEWTPAFSFEGLQRARTAAAQSVYARALAAAPWHEARTHVERAFRSRATRLSQNATNILVARLAAAHPNPKAFLLQAEIYEGFAPGVSVDIGALRAPDFPDLDRLLGRLSNAGRVAPS